MDAKEMLAAPDFLKAHAIGTGPFIHQEWSPKEKSVFVKNPNYFEKGLPFLDKVIAYVVDDPNVSRAGYQTNAYVDWAARDINEAEDMFKTSGSHAVYLQYHSAQGVNVTGFHFQMKNPKWQDIRVRRAFSLGVDRKGFADARYIGEGSGYSKPPIAWQV